MAALVGARERLFGFGEPVRSGEQHGEPERAAGVAALVGSAIRRPGTRNIAAFFEQHAQVVSGGGVAAIVRAREPFLGFGQPVVRNKHSGELERAVRAIALVGQAICDCGISHTTSPACAGSSTT